MIANWIRRVLDVRRFRRNESGIAALEFALVLPVMLVFYLGCTECGNGLALDFRTDHAARTIADLSSRYTSLDASTVSDILNAAFLVTNPYSSASMLARVSEVTTDSKGKATVTWSCALHGTPNTIGATVTLPNNVNLPNISLIWAEVSYPFVPNTGYVLTGTINLNKNAYFYPRLSTSISGPTPVSACPKT